MSDTSDQAQELSAFPSLPSRKHCLALCHRAALITLSIAVRTRESCTRYAQSRAYYYVRVTVNFFKLASYQNQLPSSLPGLGNRSERKTCLRLFRSRSALSQQAPPAHSTKRYCRGLKKRQPPLTRNNGWELWFLHLTATPSRNGVTV